MKNILFIAALSLSSLSFAQGNLQFNQVVNLEYPATVTGNTMATIGTITVPANKVWKIEHANITRDAGAYFYSKNIYASLYLNNIRVVSEKHSNMQFADPLPLWLSEGTYSVILSNETSSVFLYIPTISAIEFNVIP